MYGCQGPDIAFNNLSAHSVPGMDIFRIIPEFRILGLTSHIESQLQNTKICQIVIASLIYFRSSKNKIVHLNF